MFVTNPSADRRPYDAELRAQLSQAQARAARGRLAAWDGLCPFPTPAWPMPGLARALGIASLTIKDESCRSALGSFKALGQLNIDSLRYPYEAMHQLGLKYGPVMTVGLGPETWVVLSSFEAMKEFCMLEEAVARPHSPTFHEIYSFPEIDQPLGNVNYFNYSSFLRSTHLPRQFFS